MGVVLSAVHIDLDTRVAIKILHGAEAQNPEAAGRFLREAQAASKLRSEFVARVTDFGRLADGQPFMVMELLEGEDFEIILARGRSLRPRRSTLSSRPARRWPRRTPPGSSTATSSRPTCFAPRGPTGRRA